MLRRTKFVGSGALVAVAAVGVAVPAYAASTSSAPTTTTPATTKTAHHPTAGRGLDVLGVRPAVIAKDAGTDIAGLKADRKGGKTLTQIAASHGVSRATLVSRLDATADAKIATLINRQLPMGPGKGCNTRTGPKPGGTKAAPGVKGHRRGWRGVPGVGADYKGLASTLKLTPQQLTADLKKGQTLQQIATTQKVSTPTLLAALDKDVNAAISKAIDRVPQAKKTHVSTGSTSN